MATLVLSRSPVSLMGNGYYEDEDGVEDEDEVVVVVEVELRLFKGR